MQHHRENISHLSGTHRLKRLSTRLAPSPLFYCCLAASQSVKPTDAGSLVELVWSSTVAGVVFVSALLLGIGLICRGSCRPHKKTRKRGRGGRSANSKTGVNSQAIVDSVDFSPLPGDTHGGGNGAALPLVHDLLGECTAHNQVSLIYAHAVFFVSVWSCSWKHRRRTATLLNFSILVLIGGRKELY